MPYVILDPTIDYASYMVRFLARQGHAGIAVFTSPQQAVIWEMRWKEQLGHAIVATFVGPAAPSVEVLAEDILRRWPEIQGIIPWDEGHVVYGAALGMALGLDWNSVEVVRRCRDKHLMKAWLRGHSDVRLNAAMLVQDAGSALAFQRHVGSWPVVVKPTGGSGSTDVAFPANESELLQCCQKVLEGGRGQVLLEEYIGGEEYAVNGMVDRNGDVLITDIWRYERRSSHGLDNVCFGAWKVDADEPVFAGLARYSSDVVEGLGLRRAPFHLEAKVDGRGPCLIEVGARFGGGQLPGLASSLHGRDLFELAACHYLAELELSRSDVDFRRYDSRAACVLLGVQEQDLPGIRQVLGAEAVQSLDSFVGFGLLRPLGTPALRTVDLNTRAWEVYLMHADSRQLALDAARTRQLLRYR